MFGQAKEDRDRWFRRRILEVLSRIAPEAPTGMLDGPNLLSNVNEYQPPSKQLEDPAEALRLCRALVSAGLAREEEIKGRQKWQLFGLEWVRFGITDRGEQLIRQKIEKHPLVDDDRA